MKIYILIILTLFCQLIKAQPGGDGTYEFLNLTQSARIAALGGKNVSLNDNDLNMAYYNPALLSPEMQKNLALNYVDYFAGINYGYALYSFDKENIGSFAGGIEYVNYGTFIEADRTGLITGNFQASEYAINLIFSRQIDSSFRVGINVKPLYSALDGYNSLGIAADLGIVYTDHEGLFTAGAVLRNLGTQITTYTGNYEHLPFEIIAGISQKLKYAPFRFSFTFQQLQKYDLTYTIPGQNVDSLTGQPIQENKLSNFADNIMRHVIAGVEFIPFKNFYFSLSYNYERSQELSIEDKQGSVGISWGFGFKISRFRFSYGRATYHLAGASNHFSIVSDLSALYHH
jgi:hypothetical protein